MAVHHLRSERRDPMVDLLVVKMTLEQLTRYQAWEAPSPLEIPDREEIRSMVINFLSMFDGPPRLTDPEVILFFKAISAQTSNAVMELLNSRPDNENIDPQDIIAAAGTDSSY